MGPSRSSGAGVRSESAQLEADRLAHVLHEGQARPEAEGLVDVHGERRLDARIEREAVGHATALEHVVAIPQKPRPQADRLLEPARPGFVLARSHLDRLGYVARLGQLHPDRLEPGPIRVEPEAREAVRDLRSAEDPPDREILDARQQARGRDGLRLEHHAAVVQLAGDLMQLARCAAGKDRHGEHDRRAPRHPPSTDHENTAQLLTSSRSESRDRITTITVNPTRRTLHRWIGMGSSSGARARNSDMRSRPSFFISVRSWVGLAIPRVAANASAISSDVKYL